MKLEFYLNSNEIWDACVDLHAGALLLNKGNRIIFLYFLSWGIFWSAAVVSLAVFFDDQNVVFRSYVSEILLASAFLAFYIFNKYADSSSPENFKSLTKGNEGNHQLELGEEVIYFKTPSGKIEILWTDVINLMAINKHLIIYTAIWSCYIPLGKFEKEFLNQVAKLLQDKTSLTLVNKIENE